MNFNYLLDKVKTIMSGLFGDDLAGDTTGALYKIYYAITQVLFADVYEPLEKAITTDNDIYTCAGNAMDRLYSQNFIIRKAESKAKGKWITTDSTPGTNINAMQLKIQVNDNLTFVNTNNVTINSQGIGEFEIECEQFGSIGNVEVNTINTVKTPIPGLGTGTNIEALYGGADLETDYEYRKRYLKLRGAITGLTKTDLEREVLEVAGVLDVSSEENDTENNKVLDNGLTLERKSWVLFVNGGASTDIAKAISLKCNYSIPMYGDIEEQIYSEIRDKYETIKFFRAKGVKVYFKIEYVGVVDLNEVRRIVRENLIDSSIKRFISSYQIDRELRMKIDDTQLKQIKFLFSINERGPFKEELQLKVDEFCNEVEEVIVI